MNAASRLTSQIRPGHSPSMPRIRALHLAAVAAGGAIGALLRVALSERFPVLPGQFPLTTLAENVTGAFLLGVFVALLKDRVRGGDAIYLFACTGILGSFTTFSALSLEIADLAQRGNVVLALAYPLTSVALGLLAALAGMVLASALRTRAGRGEGGR